MSAHRHNRVGLVLVAGLSVLAGMTDAIGFLSAGDYVSFMSGNTTRLAVAIALGDSATLLRLLLIISLFVVGNALGIVVARLSGRQALPLLLLTAGLLAAAAGWSVGSLPGAVLLPLIAAVLAMGMINAAVEQVNGQSVGLTYVTGALSRLGRGLGRWLLGARHPDWLMQATPWIGMLGGAIVGAWLQHHLGLMALFASSGWAALIGLASLLIPRRWQLHYMPR
ncbi:YoaK family protein [Pseudomonas asuensis]|uniref:YoaK family protein n=1 Tax=Pseudomonas asuensis TaxID=1825787 RepID=UPI001E58BFF3|nr:YoaK family protein [Pseudomonas asuensis]